MSDLFLTIISVLKDPVNIVLTGFCGLLIVALVWMSQCYSREREYNRLNAAELVNNTKVLQELTDMVKILVLGRGGSK